MNLTLYDRIFKPKLHRLDNGKTVLQKRSRTPLIVLIVAILFYLSMQITEVDFEQLAKRGEQFFVILLDMVPPDWEFMPKVWEPIIATIQMSVLGSILGAVLAIPFALLASNNIIRLPWLNGLFKLLLSIMRTLPTLVTALIATFVFGLGATAGMIAIFIFTLAYVGKLMYENIENIDMSVFEAHESMGLSKVEAFRYAIVPEILPTYLSTSLFAFEGNVRYASILGYVGAGGIGLLLNERLGWRDYPGVGMILLVLMVVVFIIEQISEYFRKKLS